MNIIFYSLGWCVFPFIFVQFCYLCSLNLYLGSYICSLDQTSNCPFYSLLYNSCHWVMEESIKLLLFFPSCPCSNRTLLFLCQWHWEAWINIDKTSDLFEKLHYDGTQSLTISHLQWHRNTKFISLTSTCILSSGKIILMHLHCSHCNWLPKHTVWIHFRIWEQNLTTHNGNFIIRFTRLMYF